jgi:hypothetical protein
MGAIHLKKQVDLLNPPTLNPNIPQFENTVALNSNDFLPQSFPNKDPSSKLPCNSFSSNSSAY